MADRNKTELTLRVTEAAALWLSGIGCKGCEAEVMVAPGWLADLAAFWSPTRTEAVKQKLIPRCPPWRIGVENAEARKQWDDKFMAMPPYISITCEVKTSLAGRYPHPVHAIANGPREPPFTAPPKPELVLVKWRATGSLEWIDRNRLGLSNIPHLDVIDETTGKPV